jgi:hypothetical protein
MALFTDTSVVTLDDLLQFEVALVQVASTHGINVSTKIDLSLSAIGDKLMLWLLSIGASDPQWLNRRLLGLSTVVVLPTLRRWITFDALSRFYAEAYNVQLNTRFQGKWTEYQNEADKAERMVFMTGLGIVYNALPKPAMPLVSIENGTASAESMFLQTAWIDASENESALSAVNGQILSGAAGIAVAMAEGSLNAPPAAAGWNIYASAAQNNLTRQNISALPVGSTWQLPTSGLVAGPQPVNGQMPNVYVTLSQQIKRG